MTIIFSSISGHSFAKLIPFFSAKKLLGGWLSALNHTKLFDCVENAMKQKYLYKTLLYHVLERWNPDFIIFKNTNRRF